MAKVALTVMFTVSPNGYVVDTYSTAADAELEQLKVALLVLCGGITKLEVFCIDFLSPSSQSDFQGGIN